jgi:predicted transcriptional regulator
MSSKTFKQLERHFKGASNHYRIAILLLLSKKQALTLEQIVVLINANTKTISEHTRRLVIAGLVDKVYVGRNVVHTLSPYGKTFVDFIKTFSHS